MSLRDSLRHTVARCTPQAMQHATFAPDRATASATTVQQPSCTGHQGHPLTRALKLHELHGPSTYDSAPEMQGTGARVARCTPLVVQHATTLPDRATAAATPVQQGGCMTAASPPRIRPRSCTSCRHLSHVKTCTQPVAAGLLDSFAITWPEPGRGVTCPAWRRNPADAVLAVLVAAGRGGWSDTLMHQWLADAGAHPEATLDALRAGGPTP